MTLLNEFSIPYLLLVADIRGTLGRYSLLQHDTCNKKVCLRVCVMLCHDMPQYVRVRVAT